MANRYSGRSDRERDRNRGEDFGGSRRDRNFNEYNRGQQFGNYERGWRGAQVGQGRGWNQGSGGRERGSNRDFDRQSYGGRKRGDDRYGRVDVGRDFMTNQPIREGYGEIDDRSRFGQTLSGREDFGRSSRDYGREFRYSEPNRDFSERGGYSGATYSNYDWRDRERGFGMDFENRDYDFDTGRTEFDESIAGRPYYGNERNYQREGWRAYGSRPGSMGFGERERPDEWDRTAYRGRFGERGPRDFFGSDYPPTQYGRDYPRTRDDWWTFDRFGRGDYTGAGYYRGDYDRERGEGESFGEKIKNFFGFGPKNYRRGDDRIREDISERLEDHSLIDASDIEVVVIEGEVTLTGTVDNRRAKRLAEDVVDDVRGVKDVHNHIRVSQIGTGSTSQPTTGTTGTTTPTSKKGSERAA
jgi:hypothetical protein